MRMSRAPPPPPPRAQWYLRSCVDGVINININININVRDVHQASGIRHREGTLDTWDGLDLAVVSTRGIRCSNGSRIENG